MSGVFADAFFYIALLNPRDRAHARAAHFARTSRRPVTTTTWVLVEVADALNFPGCRSTVHLFLKGLEAHASTRIIPADQAWYAKGMDLYGARSDKAWSLTDCMSFAVMIELGLIEALTGDHHFEQAGFLALLKSP